MRRSTLDPAAEARRARRLFSSALMSDTKWRKALAALADSGLTIDRMSVKFIDVAEPRSLRFPPSLQCPQAYMDTGDVGPIELSAIEWLQIDQDVAPILASVGHFPLEYDGTRTRIIGYRR